jgi:hypothetical protein
VNGTLKALYFLGVLAEIAIRLPHERRRRRTRIAVGRVTTSERSLVGLVFVGLFFVPAAYALTAWLDGANYRLSPEARERAGVAGAALIVAAVWLFWRSHARHRRRVPVNPPPYVRFHVALGHRTSPRATELDRRLGRPGLVRALVPFEGAPRGADDA